MKDLKMQINNYDKRKDYNKLIKYIIVFLLIIVLIGGTIYIIVNSRKVSKEENKPIINNTENEIEENKPKIGYVMCDDNSSPLNVRSSIDGKIIDSISCYKKVSIEAKETKTDTCDMWYKVNYNKHDNKYTGFVCGSYIKDNKYEKDVTTKVENILSKASKYYSDTRLKVYCGDTSSRKIIPFDNDMTGEYLKSEFKNIDELKEDVYSFLSKDLVKEKLEVSDYNNKKYYDNYYIIDDNLYCRNYNGQGIKNIYTGNYDFEITEYKDNLINLNLSLEFLKNDSSCKLSEIDNCPNNNFIYELFKVTIKDGVIEGINKK